MFSIGASKFTTIDSIAAPLNPPPLPPPIQPPSPPLVGIELNPGPARMESSSSSSPSSSISTPVGGGVDKRHHFVKHEILRTYLQAWLPIMASRNKRGALYFDTFAGPGVYDDGSNGSPMIAIDVVKNHTRKEKFKNVHFYFVELDKKKYESLSKVIQTEQTKITSLGVDANFSVCEGDFERRFPIIIDPFLNIPALKANLGVFAFIDPFGYTLSYDVVLHNTTTTTSSSSSSSSVVDPFAPPPCPPQVSPPVNTAPTPRLVGIELNPGPGDRLNEAEEYFYLYQDNNGFEFFEDETLDEGFIRLTQHMNWPISAQRRHRKTFETRIEIDIQYYIQHGHLEDFNHYMLNELGYTQNSNRYRKPRRRFDQHIGVMAEEQLDGNILALQNVIIRYHLNLLELPPDTKSACKQLIKLKLFVNIYDFIAENETKFSNEKDLAIYTINTTKIYPKKSAKESFTYKVLLRNIFKYYRYSNRES